MLSSRVARYGECQMNAQFSFRSDLRARTGVQKADFYDQTGLYRKAFGPSP